MSPCLHISMAPCLPVTMSPCLHGSISLCLHVSMFKCLDVSRSPFSMSPSTCFQISANGKWQLPLVCCKWKRKLQTSLFLEDEDRKRKFVFLGQQMIHNKRQLLYQQRYPSMAVHFSTYLPVQCTASYTQGDLPVQLSV
jgi:hypothetical protein